MSGTTLVFCLTFDALEQEGTLAETRRPLDRINEVVDWEIFWPFLEEQREYRKSQSPRRPAKDRLLMLKIFMLQDLHGLSDEETEF